MKKFLYILLLFCSAGSLHCLFAETLTWQDCIDIANKTNNTLVMAKQDLKIAEYDYNVILNKYYPSVNFRYGFTRSGNGHTANNWSASLNASQTIYNFQSNAQIHSQKATINKTVAQLTKSSSDVYFSIRQAFLQMCYAQENITLLENIYNMRKQSADIVRLQYEGGKESKGNMLRAQAQKQSAYVNVSNAKRDLAVARRTLAQNLGTELSSVCMVDYKLEEVDDNTKVDVDNAVANCPDVILSSSSVEITRYSIDSTKGNLYPNISASASIGVSDENNPIPPADSKNWSVGVALNYPILSGGITSTLNSVKAANTALEKAQESYKQTILATKTSLEEVLADIERTKDNIEIYGMFLEAATQRQKEATIKYRAGTMEFQTWQDIEQEYVNNQMSHLSALYNYNLALAKRDKLLGDTHGEIK
ncbi:TolC family protein [Candidatus Ruminimicrobiellum ovillum]|uniref:TolC family protein n=1 Tax=Candidatus Ruminimicrobiellum ovillum TaxID=1947927 RepID=UPI00355AA618